MGFLVAVVLIMLTVLGGATLLMGVVALVTAWQFWAALFALGVIGRIWDAHDRRVARR
jgi:hypothetical protein